MIESGTKVYRSRMKMTDEKIADCDFYTVYPLMMKFCLPGDVWRIHTDMLVRYQPMLAPTLTRSHARVRFAFVPLRLLEEDAELVITGSKDGHLYTGELPRFKTFFEAPIAGMSSHHCVHKGDFANFAFGMAPNSNLDDVSTDEAMPAAYFYKAYCRFWWDYFRDENLWHDSASMESVQEFDDFFRYMWPRCFVSPSWMSTAFIAHGGLLPTYLQKNYLTSSLPWQLKGVAPTIGFDVSQSAIPDFGVSRIISEPHVIHANVANSEESPFYLGSTNDSGAAYFNRLLADKINELISSGLSINMADFRAMAAQTRVFERLARTGSRYTEYLRANFNTSPADGTLQRAQYLGGYKIPIVTSEVLQTANDGDTPVGTMRGHGITRGGDHMQTFHCKEFGVLLVTVDFRPEITWTQGVDRQFTYKRRFDFFNPSFQHLSEQEVRNGEVYIAADGKNDDTFGFQAYAQELRMGRKMVVGDMADTLAYWTQTIDFSARPNLNSAFLNGWYHLASVHKPFAVTDGNPIIIQFAARSDVYRPMVRYSTPGLVDHL